jgi:hypothetical protein
VKKQAVFALVGAISAAITGVIVFERKRHKYEAVDIANCLRCHKHIQMRTACSWIRHMIEDHKCSDDHAYQEVENAWKKIKVIHLRGEK